MFKPKRNDIFIGGIGLEGEWKPGFCLYDPRNKVILVYSKGNGINPYCDSLVNGPECKDCELKKALRVHLRGKPENIVLYPYMEGAEGTIS